MFASRTAANAAPSATGRAFLPSVVAPPPPPAVTEIRGTLRKNGSPVAGQEMKLMKWTPIGFADTIVVATTAQGEFRFTGLAELGSGEHYLVRYDTAPIPAADWCTSKISVVSSNGRIITRATAGPVVNTGVLDVTDITPLSMGASHVVSLPATFRWIARATSPNDVYRVVLYPTAATHAPRFSAYTTAHTNSLTLATLPAGIETGVDYYYWIESLDTVTGATAIGCIRQLVRFQ